LDLHQIALVCLFVLGCLAAVLFARSVVSRSIASRSIASRSMIWAESKSPEVTGSGASGVLELSRSARARVHGPMSVLVFLALAGLGLLFVSMLMWGFGELTLLRVLTRADHPIIAYFSEHRDTWFTTLMQRITVVGNRRVTLGLALVVGLWFLAVNRYWVAPVLLVLTWLAIAQIQTALKHLVAGTVPDASLALGPAGPFPSGGAARIVGVAAMSAWLLGRIYGGSVSRWAWSVVALLGWLEAYSRIYLGRHWVLDVLGGVLLGSLVAGVLAIAGSFLPPPRSAARKGALRPDPALPRL